ncbi:glycosyltransferase [Nakamurella alba]|uniref:glycosyltransferase n=1 Tax=Nakamurella alba TaxID=2665158 RepID=UPI0018AC48EC|nr:glycosyltransferase family 4 protein [Nakamurella alba]
MTRPAPSGPGPLRITLVTPGFPPVRGGVEEHVGRLAAELARGGDDVRVLTADRSAPTGTVIGADGLEIRTVRAAATTAMSIAPGMLPEAFRRIRRAGGPVRRASVPDDVVHVHSYHASSGFAALAGRKRPLVLTPHYHGGGHTAAARALHLVYGLAGRLMFRSAAAVICVSDAERDLLEADFPATRGRTVVIPNGADTTAIRAAAPFLGEPPTVLVVGRLEPYKGVHRMAEAMVAVPGAQLVIIGSGSSAAELRSRADALGLGERLRLLGGVDTADLHRWLRTASVLVSLSDHEAFGMAPLEAAAAGARVVLSDIPAHREITRRYLGDAAVLLPARDSDDPAGAAVDTDRIAAAVNAALDGSPRVVVDVPDWVDIARSTRQVYLDVIRSTVNTPISNHRGHHMGTSARSSSRSVSWIDRPWADHWSAIMVTPVVLPDIEAVRAMVERVMADLPTAPHLSVLDPQRQRWVPVAAAARRDRVVEIVRPIGDPVPGAEDDLLNAIAADVDPGIPMWIGVGPSTVGYLTSHVAGDAATGTAIIRAVIDLDEDLLRRTLLGRATTATVTKAAWQQFRAHGRDWVRAARHRGDTGPAAPDAGVAGAPTATADTGAQMIGMRLSNKDMIRINKWRNRNAKGASITAVLAVLVRRALVTEGIPVRADGMFSLFDLRRYAAEGAALTGNLGKSIYLPCDLTDPTSVDHALQETIDSGRPAAATLIGAVLHRISSVLRRGSGEHGSAPAGGSISMTFNSMPGLPGTSDLPWLPGREKVYVGGGFPVSADGITIFAHRLREHMEITVSAPAHLDAAAIRRAITALPELTDTDIATPAASL